MALSLLKSKVEREGFLKKTASAKGKDQFRGNWQERWFVLKGHNVEYYKKKGDGTPKGIIDLRAARVDDADGITSCDFTIRISQSKQVFHYLQCSSQQDKDEWIHALRKCAGYKIEDIDVKYNPKTQIDAQASFGVLFTSSVYNKPDVMVLLFDANDKCVKLFHDGKIIKPYPNSTISMVQYSKEPTRPINSELSLYHVSVDFRVDNYLNRKTFWLGTVRDAEMIHDILCQVSQSSLAAVTQMLRESPLHSGFIQMQESKDSKWKEVWALVLEQRIILFLDRDGTVPWRVLNLAGFDLQYDGRLAFTLEGNMGHYSFRCSDEGARDIWYRFVNAARITLKERMTSEVKSQEFVRQLSSPRGQAVFANAASGAISPRNATATHDRPTFENVGALTLADREDSFVLSWGLGTDGQLGHRSKDNQVRATVVTALSQKNMRLIQAGATHAAGITDKGHLYVWGSGAEGQLGLGENRKQSSSPYLVTSLSTHPVMRVSCGTNHTLALTSVGRVFAWGSSAFGQLGLATHKSESYPVEIQAMSRRGVRDISAGGDHSAAVTVQGDVWVWGCNTNGRLGLGHDQHILIPTECEIDQKKISCKSVVCGTDYTAFITDDNKLYTCGNGSYGKLGHGDVDDRFQPTLVDFFTRDQSKVTQVSVGAHHMIALINTPHAQGSIFSWGRATYNGFTTDQGRPTPLRGLGRILYCHSSHTHTLLIDDEYHAYAFGVNDFAQLGNTVPFVTGLTPVKIPENYQVVHAACGNGFSLILVRGDDPQHQIGTHASSPSSTTRQDLIKQLEVDSKVIDESTANVKIATLLNAMQINDHDNDHDDDNNVPAPPATSEVVTTVDNTEEKKKKKKGKWKEAVDQGTGRTYYFNTKTRETRWLKPQDDDL